MTGGRAGRTNGKVLDRPPYDDAAEAKVLGCALIKAETAEEVVQLPSELFYVPAHRAALEAMARLLAESPSALSVPLVVQELQREGRAHPDTATLIGWHAEAPGTAQLPGYIARLRTLHRDRTRLAALGEARLALDARDDDAWDRAVTLLTASHASDPGLPEALDWRGLHDREQADEDWLVDDLWPAGRAISVVADRKSGKSHLMLWVAGCLAQGIDPWTSRARQPRTIAYVDFEMTEDDVHERAFSDFGWRPEDLHRLRYYLLPSLPPLDTPAGGQALLALLRRDEATVAVIDTYGRAVQGPEDQADTVRNFYRCTAFPLKAAGIATARLDHVGHSDKTRARGSSSKAEDIDVAWMLTRGQGNGMTLDHRGVSRLRWVPRILSLAYIDGPPGRYRQTTEQWPEGTTECADLLDRIGVPLDASVRAAQAALRDAGESRRTQRIQAALKWRRTTGNTPGNTTPETATGDA